MTSISTEKQEALKHAIANIEKQFGKGSLLLLGDTENHLDIQSISTGSMSLDTVLGIGGIPRGRVTEIYGPESGGKTTLALHMIAEAQAAGGIAGFIDAEHALDPTYASRIGVKVNELYVSQPDNGEQALDIAESMVRSGAFDIIVVDSVAALVPKAEIEGNMDDQQVGLHARLMSKALRKLTAVISQSECAFIFINQIREKVGVFYGPTETTTGGRALRYYASVRLDIRRKDSIKDKGLVVGNRVKVKVVKNKVAPPFRETEFDIIFGKGIDKDSDFLDFAVQHDVVKKAGAWYSYQDTKLGQGRNATIQFLSEHPEIKESITKELFPSGEGK